MKQLNKICKIERKESFLFTNTIYIFLVTDVLLACQKSLLSFSQVFNSQNQGTSQPPLPNRRGVSRCPSERNPIPLMDLTSISATIAQEHSRLLNAVRLI